MQRLVAIFAFLLIVPVLSACNDEVSAEPSTDEITTAVIERFRNDPYARVAHVENVQKTNSVAEGEGVVTVMVSYDMVFDRSISDFADDVVEQSRGVENLDAAGAAARDAVDVLKMKMLALKEGGFTVGDRRGISNEIRMVKSEKGWIYRP
ncbi:hypothetical protein [Thalassospira marina]|uniref:Lipoprotein n=1 Tax=Thalassospira marina TaxID=2048283 RepID=A0A2N3KVY3_9PROT|nr:hypothetical protein [Thalassospira marina]AUG54637.1 hypothetical protein CSC3H3_19375 [Thalassospira marina]PKR54646.1 hypothetical protein COO20_07795 [Thalassospira marina]